MIRFSFVIAFVAVASAAMAQINASAKVSFVQNGPNYTYDIALTNTGTTTIGTLWYAWIPGEDYLPIPPTSTASPSGWQVAVINGTAAGFGYSLQWKVSSSAALLPSGSTLDGFTFTTTTAPAAIFGNSTFGSHPPIDTSFVYEGVPFSGTSKVFVVNPTPEPASFAALGLGALAVLRRRTRNR